MQKIIFTDLDGTLTLKDTYTKFLLQNLTPSLVLKNSWNLLSMVVQHSLKTLGDDGVKMRTFKMFFDGYDTRKPFDDFVKTIPWNTKVLDMIEQKRQEGYKVIIVTASPDVYVTHVCKHLGFDGFICTKTQKKGDLLNGEIDGKICNFEQKPQRINEFLNQEKPEHTISFGNSSGDYAMLEFCDESYFVKKLDIKRYES
jgi:HAD superfamily hydrolase (TIGR01490 family)